MSRPCIGPVLQEFERVSWGQEIPIAGTPASGALHRAEELSDDVAAAIERALKVDNCRSSITPATRSMRIGGVVAWN